MKKLLYRVITACVLIGWMAIIFWFSAQPAGESSEISGSVSYRVVEKCNHFFEIGWTKDTMEEYAKRIEHPIRKAAHMTEYAVLAVAVFLCFYGYEYMRKRIYLLTFLVSVCYAASDEIHQLFVPGRSGQLSDVCVDAVGVVAALLFVYLIRKVIGKYCEKKQLTLQ